MRTLVLGRIRVGYVVNMADECATTFGRPKRLASIRRFQSTQAFAAKQELKKKLRKVSKILKKKEAERTADEINTLHQLPDIVKTAEKNVKRLLLQKERILEIEDEPDVLDQKCQEFAQMLLSAENAVVYTGAGISTAASIPDYRGPNGVWTLLKKGQSLRAQDLVDAEPTYTHMCITKLYKTGRVKYLVSQNCDGLHIRSGFPRHSMSEVHGNMFIEICKNCKPQKEYLRLFDVTERTAKGRHKTGRSCKKCGGSLCDSIVHFGEKGGLRSPYRWKQAAKAACNSDLIICLGSSLKVLRRYPCLWSMNIRPENRPKLVIVNLQWTPKDEQASLKIHGRCDDVLKRLAHHLALTVPPYLRETDPLFRLHTPVLKQEESIASKKTLKTSGHKPCHKNGHKKKRCHEMPTTMAVRQQPTLCSAKYQQRIDCNDHDISSIANFKSESPSETASRICGQIIKAEGSSLSENKHIPDPVRLKLEQMLKERGVINKTSTVTSNGTIRLTEGNISVQQPGFISPLPSIQNFVLQNVNDVSSHQSHPHLRNLLSTGPSHFQEQTVTREHDVFRIDLSTDPVKITSTHCPANSAGLESFNKVSSTLSAGIGMNSHTSSCASNSNYAKLIRSINFDHSYSKNPHKSRPSGKVQNAIRDSLSCSVNPVSHLQVQSSQQFSVPSVISVCPSLSDLNVVHSDVCFRLNSQNILPLSQKVIGSIPASINLQTGEVHHEHSLPHFTNTNNSATQGKVVINLNCDAGIMLQTSHQSLFPSMQVQQDVNPVFAPARSEALSSFEMTQNVAEKEDNSESDSGSSISQPSTKKKETTSIPGWFGKGLRVRRKRTL